MITQAAEKGKSTTSGTSVVMIGLFVQLGFIAAFMLLTIYIGLAALRKGSASPVPHQVFVCMWVTMALIIFRNVYRVVEYLQGQRGYLARHEAFFYVFDFCPILLAFWVLVALPYGRYMPVLAAPVAPGPQQPQAPQAYVSLVNNKAKSQGLV